MTLPRAATRRVVILQNYHTPYRHALFEEAQGRGVDLTVVYLQRPEDEGRKWDAPPESSYTRRFCRRIMLGRAVFFIYPLKELFLGADTVVVLDNNPTNICLLLWLPLLRFRSKQLIVWIEHVADNFKSRAKLLYQRICSRILLRVSDAALVFSDASAIYAHALSDRARISRVHQSVPPPPTRPSPLRPRAPRRFGYLGSDSPRKNVAALLEAFSDPALQRVILHIGGFELDRTAHARPDVVLHGYVSGEARERFFDEIDFLILPSLAEPWGLVVNEAISRGCVPIVSEACGSAELVHQINSNLVFRRSVADIVCSVTWASQLSDLDYQHLQERGARAIAAYTLPRAAEELIDAVACLSA